MELSKSRLSISRDPVQLQCEMSLPKRKKHKKQTNNKKTTTSLRMRSLSWNLQVGLMTQIKSNCNTTEENVKERLTSNFQNTPQFYTAMFLFQNLLPTT